MSQWLWEKSGWTFFSPGLSKSSKPLPSEAFTFGISTTALLFTCLHACREPTRRRQTEPCCNPEIGRWGTTDQKPQLPRVPPLSHGKESLLPILNDSMSPKTSSSPKSRLTFIPPSNIIFQVNVSPAISNHQTNFSSVPRLKEDLKFKITFGPVSSAQGIGPSFLTGNLILPDSKGISAYSPDGTYLNTLVPVATTIGGYPLNNLWGLAVDKRTDWIYVTDSSRGRILVLDAEGKFIRNIGGKGTGPDTDLNARVCVIDSQGYLYTPDSNGTCVKVFNSDGEFVRKFGEIASGCLGITVDAENNIYVSEHPHHRINVFDFNDKHKEFIGQRGDKKGDLLYPFDIDIDRDGHLVVSDAGNYRIQVFDKERNVIKMFGQYGDQIGQFACPFGMKIDRDGNICVVEQSNSRVQIFGGDS